MPMLRVTLCCGVLWGLSLGCATPSATVRQETPVQEAVPTTEVTALVAPLPAKVTPRTGYGYTPQEPIKVGGGPQGQREYLQFLRGPEGQKLRFQRSGSCCGFEDASLPFGGGLLDMYEVTYDGLEAPVMLFLDMYRREPPRAPAGFRLD